MNIVDQERNQFDKWLRAQPHVLNVGFNKLTQEYLLSEDQDQWIGWQARAELSLKTEARIEELEEVIKAFLDWTTNEHGNLSLLDDVALWKRAEEVLKK